MEKFKLFIYVLFIGLGLGINAQTKIFTPKKGEIVFREISKITDKKLYDETLKISKEKFQKTLQSSLLKEEENKGKEEQIKQMTTQNAEMMGFIMFPQDSSQVYTFRFDNSKIISSDFVGETVLERYDVIDIQKNTTTAFSTMDSITPLLDEKEYTFSNNILLKTTVDMKIKKIIHGYVCYKVVYEYKENNEGGDEDHSEFIKDTIYKREMWVTDVIKSLHHPIVHEKSILEKYYPLEILETQSDIKGFERKYILEKITLK